MIFSLSLSELERGILLITKFVLKLNSFPLKHTLVLQWNEKQLVLFAIRASVELEVTYFVTVEKIVKIISF